ncbi:MAG: Voltage-gated ClC-type chloride channel ClcB [Hyphomicrobiaceae bacterium hypho_1]
MVAPYDWRLYVGIIGLYFPKVHGFKYEAKDAALKSHYPLCMMLVLLITKVAAIAITLATRFSNGVFLPAIYIGAMVESSFSVINGTIFPQTNSNDALYAILGMAAVRSAVFSAPISRRLLLL